MLQKNKDWIMYYDVKRLLGQGRSQREIAEALGLNRRTVKRYGRMSEAEFARFESRKETKAKALDPYEIFVRDRLIAAPAATTAQVHDWLKEHHPDIQCVSAKTVYNFVIGVRQKYQIPIESAPREYFMVESMPYGEQAQADFGQCILQTNLQGRKRVYFFVMMLSRSRMKYVFFSDTPFNTYKSIVAHEASFCSFGGLPRQLVYDQDKLFLTDERLGELLLTQEFKNYTKEQRFDLHFCRKSDPQSKGKVENCVKYIKSNFLYGRIYHDLETLQREAIAWLERTGNGVAHSVTRKIPLQEWEYEKPHLTPWNPINIEPSRRQNFVRKDNTVPYRGNFYSVPQGTYKKGVTVRIAEVEGQLHIYDDKDKLLCKHTIPEGKGHSVLNNNHKRDRSLKIAQLITASAMLFEDSALANTYFEKIRKDKPRYIRDQIHAITTAIRDVDVAVVSLTLTRCMEQGYYSAIMFRELLQFNLKEAGAANDNIIESKIVLMDPNSAKKAAIQPDKSSLDTYDAAF